MVTLSSKAWNNILILAIVFMAFIFIFSGQQVSQQKIPVATRLLEPEQRIQKLTIANWSVHKVDEQWQVISGTPISNESIQQLIANWSVMTLHPCDLNSQPSPTEQSLPVSLALANSDQIFNMMLLYANQAPYLMIQQTCYRVDKIPYTSLVPAELR